MFSLLLQSSLLLSQSMTIGREKDTTTITFDPSTLGIGSIRGFQGFLNSTLIGSVQKNEDTRPHEPICDKPASTAKKTIKDFI